jgi:H+/gluconate symporter-like permease
MAWPLKLRATSFVVTIGVVLIESAVALLPIGIALCWFAKMDASRVFRDLAMIACAVAIAIAIHGDLGRQGYRKWWRLRA